MPASVTVEILGQEFTIRSEEDEAHVRAVAAVVEDKLAEMKRVGVSGANFRIAVLAALNVAEECVKLRKELAMLNAAVREGAGRMSDRIASRAGV